MADGAGAPDIAPPPPAIDPTSSIPDSSSLISNKSAARLAKIISTTSGLDSSLLALQYPLLLLLAPPRHAPSPRLKSLADLLSSVRIFLRLPGLLKIYLWGLSTLKSPPKDGVERAIVCVQILSSAIFQALENAAYLAQHGVVGMAKSRQKELWKWSARAWAAHVFLELGRLWRIKERRGSERKLGEIMTKAEVEKEDQWQHDMLVNLAYAPLTVHYSLESAPVGEHWVGLLGSVIGLLGWRRLWRKTKDE